MAAGLRSYRFTNDMLPITLHVLVGPFAQAVRWLDRTYSVEWLGQPGAARATVFRPEKNWNKVGMVSVIWMPYFRQGNAFDAGKLAHEALHVAWRLLDCYGCHDEETHCYMLQWIVNEITWKLTRKR